MLLKNVRFYLMITITINIFGCTFFQNQLRGFLGVANKQPHNYVPHTLEQPVEYRAYYTKHDTLLQYIASKPVLEHWHLKQLRFLSESLATVQNSVFLLAVYESRSRYNPKYQSVSERHFTEWQKYGRLVGNELAIIYPRLIQDSVFLKIAVTVKIKNYLRPNQTLKPDTLRFNLDAEYLRMVSHNPDSAFAMILSRYRQ